MTEITDEGTDDPTDRELRDLLDAERHRQLVEDRRRRRGRRQQVEEALCLGDVLGALAAHQTLVTVRTPDQALPPSRISEVGLDYVALRADGAVTRLVPLARIASATPAAITDELASSGSAIEPARTGSLHPALDLAERLRELVGLRARLRLIRGGAALAGRLRRVGADVVILEGEDGSDQFVALAALDDVEVAG